MFEQFRGQNADNLLTKNDIQKRQLFKIIGVLKSTRSGSVEYTVYYTLLHLNTIECQWVIKMAVLNNRRINLASG